MSSVPLRAGSGLMGYFLALLGMGLAGWLAIWGALKPYRIDLQELTKLTIDGADPTLALVLHLNPWIIVTILSLILIWLLFKLRSRKEETEQKQSVGTKIFKRLWGPTAIGISLGIIGIIAFVGGESPAGLGGFVKGYAQIIKAPFVGSLPLGWSVMFVIGIIIGVIITALIAGEFRVRWPNWKQAVNIFCGGFLMGLGAVTAAGGCNIAHIISHLPQLSIGSIVSAFFIMATAYLIVYLKFVRPKKVA